jgi:hypothetical protein
VRDGKELTRCAASRNSTNYIALLSDIEADNPAGDIFMITDNLSSHNSAQTRAWMAEHPRLHHVFIPKGAWWLNLQEGGWRLFRRDALAGQSFANDDESEQATLITTAQLNRRANPWIWGRPRHPITATTDDSFVIAFKERSNRLSDRLSGAPNQRVRSSTQAGVRRKKRPGVCAGAAERGNWKCWLPCHKHFQKLAYDCYTRCISKDCNQCCNFNTIAIIRKCWKHVLEWNDQGRAQVKYPV